MYPAQLQDDLLVKYSLKWCTDEEHELVSSWLDSNVNNRFYYDNLLASEKMAKIMQEVKTMNVDQKWEIFKEEHLSKRNNIIPLYEPETRRDELSVRENKPAGSIPGRLKRAIGIAASIIFILALSIAMFNRNEKIAIAQTPVNATIKSSRAFELTAENTTDSIKTINLPDQSLVRLSPKSRFSYREPGDKNTRELALTGQARFNIYKDASKPFTVYSGDIATTALGTEFTVTQNDKEKTIVVRLYEGKVVIRSSGQAMIKLKQDYFLYPMQEFVYNNSHYAAVVRSFAAPVPALAANRKIKTDLPLDNPGTPVMGRESWFMFNNQPLDQVFNQLMEMYEAEIEYSKADFSKTYLIGTFNKTDSLERILTQIATLNDLKLIKKDNKFIIKK